MNSFKLTVDFFILAIAVIWPAVHSDVCGEHEFLTIQHTNMPGATLYPDEVNADACKTKCLQENGCKAIDWNFVDSACWLHFNYDAQLKTHKSVTQYYNCKNGPLPISTEDPLSAGFPVRNRSHVFPALRFSVNYTLPVVILQPPLTAAAAFGESTVESAEFYGRWKGPYLHYFIAFAGIARPTDDGFAVVDSYGGMASEIAPVGKLIRAKRDLPDLITQPGDAIFVSPYDHLNIGLGDAYGIPYDVGAPDVCGVTSIGLLDARSFTIVPNSLKILDECWIMSIFFNLYPLN